MTDSERDCEDWDEELLKERDHCAFILDGKKSKHLGAKPAPGAPGRSERSEPLIGKCQTFVQFWLAAVKVCRQGNEGLVGLRWLDYSGFYCSESRN